jgi:hypothetical protein
VRRVERAYKDGRNEEKDEFANAYSIWMGAGMEYLIEGYALQASEKTVCVSRIVVWLGTGSADSHVNDPDACVKEDADENELPEGLVGWETEVEE